MNSDYTHYLHFNALVLSGYITHRCTTIRAGPITAGTGKTGPICACPDRHRQDGSYLCLTRQAQAGWVLPVLDQTGTGRMGLFRQVWQDGSYMSISRQTQAGRVLPVPVQADTDRTGPICAFPGRNRQDGSYMYNTTSSSSSM